ncbi:hypothetical protein GCM10010378_09360 [Streptomyces viridochromogenes]
MRHVILHVLDSSRRGPSGKKVLYTPHPGLQGACAARPSRMGRTSYVVRINEQGHARPRPLLTRSGPTLNQNT